MAKSEWKISYKIDVLDALKSAGYSTARLRKEAIIGGATVTRLRSGEFVSWDIIAQLCELLQCDITDILECRTSTGELAMPNPELAAHFPPRNRTKK